MIRITRRGLLAGASAFAITGLDGRRLLAQENIEILASLPNMAFPFFVHMMEQIQAEAEKLAPSASSKATARVQLAEADRRRGERRSSRA